MKEISWVPLESNPEILNKYMNDLQVTTLLQFQDVYGLDDDLLSMVPNPVAGVLLLFPYEAYRRERVQKQATPPTNPNLVFFNQTIGNICGTIGLYHCLANTPLVEISQGPFKEYLEEYKKASMELRSTLLQSNKALKQIHDLNAAEGQTEAPDAYSELELHFICFSMVDGHMYELDGENPYAVDHGPSEDLLKDAVGVVKEFMKRDPDEVRYTVMVLAGVE